MFNWTKRNYIYPPKILALYLLMPAVLISCIPVSEITIEILEPAEITIPSYIQTVSFANRSYIPWLAMNPSDTARRPVADLFVIDTIVSNKLFLGLVDALNASPLFDLDEQLVYQLRRSDGVRFPEALSSEQAGMICDTSLTDCLISLEGYVINDTLSHHIQFYDDMHQVIFMITGKIQWVIYDGISGTVLDDFTISDTINWMTTGNTLYDCMGELPEAVDAYREYGYQVGYKYGQRLSPEWSEARRFFYRTGSLEMMKAAKLTDKGKWNEALKLWRSVSGSDKDIIAAKASFNIALYYEMEDRLVPAIDWATKSYNQHEEKYTKQYIEILEKRKLDKLKLEQQVPAE